MPYHAIWSHFKGDYVLEGCWRDVNIFWKCLLYQKGFKWGGHLLRFQLYLNTRREREADQQIYHFYLEETLFGMVVKYDKWLLCNLLMPQFHFCQGCF